MTSKPLHIALFCSTILALTACSSSVQTGSGHDFSAANPDKSSTAFQAGNVEPLLKFPAKFCMVKMVRGEMGYMNGIENKAFFEVGARHPYWGEIAQINPMVVQLVLSEGIGRSRYSGKAGVEHIKVAAARQQCSAVLAIENQKISASEFVATALLYDTHNGYTYITASESAKNEAEAIKKLSTEVEKAMSQLAATLK